MLAANSAGQPIPRIGNPLRNSGHKQISGDTCPATPALIKKQRPPMDQGRIVVPRIAPKSPTTGWLK